MNKNTELDFVDKLEIVYAILIAWGFASVAKKFRWDWEYLQYLIICTLVLMRFFFAPSRNLKAVAKVSKERPIWQRVIFFWDVPILIAHSFIYYQMCILVEACSINLPKFYLFFYLLLLLLNVIWLSSIILRLGYLHKEMLTDDEKSLIKYLWIWLANNFIHIVIYAILCISNSYTNIDIFGKHLSLLFVFALTNCIIDFFFTAPVYLGFVKSNIKASDLEDIQEQAT